MCPFHSLILALLFSLNLIWSSPIFTFLCYQNFLRNSQQNPETFVLNHFCWKKSVSNPYSLHSWWRIWFIFDLMKKLVVPCFGTTLMKGFGAIFCSFFHQIWYEALLDYSGKIVAVMLLISQLKYKYNSLAMWLCLYIYLPDSQF